MNKNTKAPILYFNVNDHRLINPIEKWRSKGRLVFTNGCFDILHAGHISLLERAKALGDFLIVGLNSDSSIKILKGKDRPINNEANRSYILASIKFIDLIVVFNEETPKELLSIIRPSILVKGDDYKEDQIIGREYADKVIILPIVEGLSSTLLINQLKGK